MSNITTSNTTLLAKASNVNYASVVILAVSTLLIYAWYGFNVTDGPYPGLPLIGKEGVKTTQEAKQKWLVSAKSLIYDTIAKVGISENDIYCTN